jgi:hypothetical protein
MVACGPRVDGSVEGGDDGSGVDPGTCETPATDALVAIARPASALFPAKLVFMPSGAAIDCDTDLDCARYEDLEVAEGFAEGQFHDPATLAHARHDCTCEDVGTSFSDGHCDEHFVEGTILWIESVTGDCITGAIQGETDGAATPFVATLCR